MLLVPLGYNTHKLEAPPKKEHVHHRFSMYFITSSVPHFSIGIHESRCPGLVFNGDVLGLLRGQGSSWAGVCNVSPPEPRGAREQNDEEEEKQAFLLELTAAQRLHPLLLSHRKRLPPVIHHSLCQRSPSLA